PARRHCRRHRRRGPQGRESLERGVLPRPARRRSGGPGRRLLFVRNAARVPRCFDGRQGAAQPRTIASRCGEKAVVEVIPEADLVAVRPEEDQPSAKLSKGAVSWAVFEGARDPYVILIIIYIFMPYVGSVMVGYPHSNPTAGQEVISQWSQYSGWATMATAPFLGASIDQLGKRKGWLGLAVALMIPLMFGLWWAKPDGSGLPVVTVMIMTTVIGLLFSYTEVIHNSLLVRAAGLGGAHKASSLALALGNAFALALFAFLAW